MAFYRSSSGGSGNGIKAMNISVSSTYQSNIMQYMFDDDSTTWWIANTETGSVYVENLEVADVTTIIVRTGNFSNSNLNQTITIFGSNTSTSQNLTQLATITTKYSDGDRNLTVSKYKYYVVQIAGSNAAFGSLTKLAFA